MNDLQKCQFDIFKKTIEILDQNNLKYYLIGGSLLGAVRHKGFIPWDDDIDIGMPRDDYEKFAKIANEILPKELFYQDKKTDKEYPYNFAKIRKNGTLFVQKPVERFNMNQGVYIDVFPLDGSKDSLKKQASYAKKCIRINYISIAKALIDSETTQSFQRKVIVFILNVLNKFIGQKNIDKMLYKTMTKYSFYNSKYIGNLIGVGKEREVFSKLDYFSNEKKYSLVEFEGLMVKGPINPDAVLKHNYGDYMKFPPEEKRVSHHQIVEMKL